MAPKKKTVPICASIPIGDCEVTVESGSFTYESNPNNLQISVSRKANINITVKGAGNGCMDVVDDLFVPDSQEKGKEQRDTPLRDEHLFILIDPKNAQSHSKSLLQDVLKLYMKELPDMNIAANTRKESMFLERCISNGKYRTLVLQSKSSGDIEETLAAISFQIVPVDTQYAEIPLAAVIGIHQRKGLGRLLFAELRKRLQSVGVCTIYCWGDAESKGFWVKQGFESIAEVGTKGRARRLPVKPSIQRVLCFPGGSTLMVSHLTESIPSIENSRTRVMTTGAENSSHDKLTMERDEIGGISNTCGGSKNLTASREEQHENTINGVDQTNMGNKRKVWESSMSSLKSKKVRGTHLTNSETSCDASLCLGSSENNRSFKTCSIGVSNDNSFLESFSGIHMSSDIVKNHGIRVMLMNIADDTKRTHLTKVIEELGGTVVSDGAQSTHVVTGKARRTLNFCTALCSGAWIVSPVWLKESSRQGKFVDELPYVLVDEGYVSKYRSDLKSAVLRAKARPWALLEGYDICIARHVQPPTKTLASIVVSAGGQIIRGLDDVKDDPLKTIFIACEDDMDEALLAVKKGTWIFGSEWFMSCIMKQELDFKSPQFAESL